MLTYKIVHYTISVGRLFLSIFLLTGRNFFIYIAQKYVQIIPTYSSANITSYPQQLFPLHGLYSIVIAQTVIPPLLRPYLSKTKSQKDRSLIPLIFLVALPRPCTGFCSPFFIMVEQKCMQNSRRGFARPLHNYTDSLKAQIHK